MPSTRTDAAWRYDVPTLKRTEFLHHHHHHHRRGGLRPSDSGLGVAPGMNHLLALVRFVTDGDGVGSEAIPEVTDRSLPWLCGGATTLIDSAVAFLSPRSGVGQQRCPRAG